ncbi:SRPBCC domain-containing protein [Pseudoxanthobacter sp.]|uniref:SRPBCC domain-containing protein n=1 Tax=Pseudoxanthobacter sp. TaxID=1925742 RepID=UPI002FE28B0C
MDPIDVTGEHRIPAPQARVWKALTDADALKGVLPGCESVTAIAGAPTAVVAVEGFSGTVVLTDFEAPKSLTVIVDGHTPDGPARAVAEIDLVADGNSTRLICRSGPDLGGGGDSAALAVVDAFAAALALSLGGSVSPAEELNSIAATGVPDVDKLVEEVEEAAGEAEEKLEVAAGKGVLGGPVTWGFLGILVVVVLIWLFR